MRNENEDESSLLLLKHIKTCSPTLASTRWHFFYFILFLTIHVFFFLFDFKCVFWQRMMARCFLFSDFTVFLSTCVLLHFCRHVALMFFTRIHNANTQDKHNINAWRGGYYLPLSLFSLSRPPSPLSFHYNVFPPSSLSLHAWHITYTNKKKTHEPTTYQKRAREERRGNK